MNAQETELLSLQQRAASHPHNEAALLLRIKEIQSTLGSSALEDSPSVPETAEADLSEVETAVIKTKRKR